MDRAHAAVRSTRRSARSKSAPNWCAGRSAAAGNARTTTSDPDGTAPTRVHRTPTRCRSWRRTRLRTTAPPTPTPTTKPTRGGNDAAESPSPDERSALSSDGRKCTTTAPAPACRPCRTTTANSVDRRSRLAAGSTGAAAGSGRQLPAALGPPGGQHGPSCPSAHPKPEAVSFRPTAVVRLKSTLTHGQDSNGTGGGRLRGHYSNTIVSGMAEHRSGRAAQAATADAHQTFRWFDRPAGGAWTDRRTRYGWSKTRSTESVLGLRRSAHLTTSRSHAVTILYLSALKRPHPAVSVAVAGPPPPLVVAHGPHLPGHLTGACTGASSSDGVTPACGLGCLAVVWLRAQSVDIHVDEGSPALLRPGRLATSG